MSLKPRTIGIIVAGVAILAGLLYVAFRTDPVPVDLQEVVRAPMMVTIDADGQTRIREIYEVATPIAGTALRSPVAVGDPVAAGVTVVAMVEPVAPSLLDSRSRMQAEAAVREAEAALNVAETDLRRAAEEQTFAQMQHDRIETLVERGVSSFTALEDVAQRLAVANATVDSARARVNIAQSTLERAEAALIEPNAGSNPDGADGVECCVRLLAPVDGVVLDVPNISERPVTAGAPLVSVGDPSDLEIVADLLSSDAVRIGPGTRAIVERWGRPEPLEAVLTRVEPSARTRISALGIEEQRVDAIFTITSPPEAREGLGDAFSVFLRIVEWEDDEVVQVPLSALFRLDSGWAVFVAEDGRAVARMVGVGRRGTRMAEVTEGLEPGERVITHPNEDISDGVTVQDRRAL